MHALLAHVYHLALYAIHIATRPVWRSLGACLAVALAGRLTWLARQPQLAAPMAGAAVLAGWLVEAPPLAWPLTPVARLTGLAAFMIVCGWLRIEGRRAWLLPLTAAWGSWWVCGAPLYGRTILGCTPVFLGFWAALAAGQRLTQGDRGWATLAAAVGLAASLLVSGASPHWARAAGVPGIAALGLLGIPEAMTTLAGLILAVCVAALVASDRGRLVAVDVACVTPLLAWVLSPWLARFFGRRAVPIASVVAAGLCVALAWAATRVMALW